MVRDVDGEAGHHFRLITSLRFSQMQGVQASLGISQDRGYNPGHTMCTERARKQRERGQMKYCHAWGVGSETADLMMILPIGVGGWRGALDGQEMRS